MRTRSISERAAGRGGKRRARMPGESRSRHMLPGQRAPPQWTARSRDARAWLGWAGSRWTDVCGRGRQRIDQAQGLTGRRQSRQNRWTSEAGDGRPSRLGISHASDGTRRSGYVAGGGSRASPYRLAVGRGCEKRRKKRTRCRWSGVHFFWPHGLEECAGAESTGRGRTKKPRRGSRCQGELRLRQLREASLPRGKIRQGGL